MVDSKRQLDIGFADHFSGHAGDYARHRPTYPDALFDWLAGQCERRGLAWDVGSGSGQAAAALAPRFRHVVAADASLPQLLAAAPEAGVWRVNERAEQSALASGCTDLVTCAQAAHWFEHDAFHGEIRRVATPGAVVALWAYGLTRVSEAVDALVRAFHDDTLGPFWPPQRRHIENGYRELPFPYGEISAPGFEMRVDWDPDAFCDYLGTWSAYRRYLERRDHDPLPALRRNLAAAWGEGRRAVRWPLTLRVGRLA